MTIKFLHIRCVDSEMRLQATRGITVAYTNTDTEVMFRTASCFHTDNFCYKRGRDIAMGRLMKFGPEEVMTIQGNVPSTIIVYLESAFGIEIVRHPSGRWVSTFDIKEEPDANCYLQC